MFVNRYLSVLLLFIFPVFFLCLPEIVSANNTFRAVISEVAWMGTGNSANDEWIELYNNSDTPIDISGWAIKSTINSLNISLSGSIPAKGFFVLERTDDSTLPDIPADQIYTGSLSNSGENLELRDNSDNLIDSISCPGGWFAGNNATKQTMERKNSAENGNASSNWQTSQNPGGTPKFQNSSGAVISDSENNAQDQSSPNINTNYSGNNTQLDQTPKAEAGADTIALIGQDINFDGTKSSDPQNKPLSYSWNFGDGSTSDKPKSPHSYKYPGTYIVSLTVSNGQNISSDTAIIAIYSNSVVISEFIPNPSGTDENNEWLELYNNSDIIADLSHWQITTQNEKSKPFTIPLNTFISSRQFLVITSQFSKISLRNDSGSVKLIYPNGQIAQEIKYEKIGENQSVSLAGDNQYFMTALPTPGTTNLISSINNTKNNSPYFIAAAQEITSQQQNMISTGASPSQIPVESTFVIAGQIAGSDTNINSAALNSVGQTINDNNFNETPAPQTENQNISRTQTASLATKISSPLYLFFLIIILGLASGLGLVKIKRKIKANISKIPIDWQD